MTIFKNSICSFIKFPKEWNNLFSIHIFLFSFFNDCLEFKTYYHCQYFLLILKYKGKQKSMSSTLSLSHKQILPWYVLWLPFKAVMFCLAPCWSLVLLVTSRFYWRIGCLLLLPHLPIPFPLETGILCGAHSPLPSYASAAIPSTYFN